MKLWRKILQKSLLTLSVCVSGNHFLSAQFTMTPGSYITIKNGSTMDIEMDLYLQGNATSSAYFVDQTTLVQSVTITGDVTVERYLTDSVWHNVSIPVETGHTNMYGGTWLTFYYDETNIKNDWMFGWFDYSGPMEVMRGYDVFLDNGPLTIAYTGAGDELNTGPYTFGLTNNNPIIPGDPAEIPARQGWNLAGNPYASPVDWQFAGGWDKSFINDAKYIWDPIIRNYTIWIGGGTPIGINGGTQFIPSNQGFWVQAISNGTISINNTCRNGDISGTPDFYKSASANYPMLDLLASGNGFSDETIIRFIENTSNGFDWNYDASKLFTFEENVPQLSTNAGKFDVLAINSLPELKDGLEVTMNFQCATAGFYDINLTNKTILSSNVIVYLKDHFEKKIVKLSEDSTYRFYHEPGYSKKRFSIFFNPSEDILNNITPENYFSVYSFDNKITILKNTVKQINGEVFIYNLSGQMIYKTRLNNESKSEITLFNPTGYYILSIKTDESVMNFKVLIKN